MSIIRNKYYCRFLGNEWQDGVMDRDEWIIILNIMLRLRQMCCHPALFPNAKIAVSAIVGE